MSETATFLYDVGSPWCWLAGERVTHSLGVVPVWQPVLAAGLGAHAAAVEDAMAQAFNEAGLVARAYRAPIESAGARVEQMATVAA